MLIIVVLLVGPILAALIISVPLYFLFRLIRLKESTPSSLKEHLAKCSDPGKVKLKSPATKAGAILLFVVFALMNFVWCGKNFNFQFEGLGPPPVGYFDPDQPQAAILLAMSVLATGLLLFSPRRYACASCGVKSKFYLGSPKQFIGKAGLMALLVLLVAFLHILSVGLRKASSQGRTREVRFLAVVTHWKINEGSLWGTPLVTAVRNRHRQTALALLEHGADINLCATDRRYDNSPLREAIVNNDFEMVKFLLQHGASLRLGPGDCRETPLAVAAGSIGPEMVSLLIANGAKSDEEDGWGITPLMKIASNESKYFLPVARVLIAAGAKVNGHDHEGNTPLHFTVKGYECREENIRFLLEHGADPAIRNEDGKTALDYSSEKDCPAVNDLLQNPSAASNIFTASVLGRLEDVKKLVEANPELVRARDEHQRTPLHLAAMKGRLEVCAFLLEHGADFNATDDAEYGNLTPLLIADDQTAHFLLQLPAGKQLLDAGIVNRLFSRAILSDLPMVIDDLLERGFNPNQLLNETNPKEPPLQLAAFMGNLKIAEKLIAHGAKVNARDPERGLSALHTAVDSNSWEMAKFLLDHGADPNARDKLGNFTPLHYAVHSGTVQMVGLLLDHGADVNAVNSLGQTPLDLAGNRSDVTDLLEKRGGGRKREK